jgi:hypothetical protein
MSVPLPREGKFMESAKHEGMRDLADKELDEVCGGANPHPVGAHTVTGKDFQGNPNAGAPGVWGDGHPVDPTLP